MLEERSYLLVPKNRFFGDFLVENELFSLNFVIVLLHQVVCLQFGKGGSFTAFYNAWIRMPFAIFDVVVFGVPRFDLLFSTFRKFY